ncbi:MAG: phosphoribosylanthranilate isomerase [Methanosarcinales archaeon Met12]|nr:MAG: phosphoribosylanthranilate isomerase [Methanosarcinales archaeon Met12]
MKYGNVRVKICGIKTLADLDMAVECGADAVGFITDVPVDTPRKISTDTARSLVKKVPIFINSVLVIMPESASEAIAMVEDVCPHTVQIHSDLSLQELQQLRDRIDISIIKTIGVSDFNGTISRVNEVASAVDAILLDTIEYKPGGTGVVHNWEVSAKIVDDCPLPVVLAGGLTSENVSRAISIVKPYAVDVASGVEVNGKKVGRKVRAFISEVVHAQSQSR